MDMETPAIIIGHIQASRYVSGAGLVVLLYDHILTFDQELQSIWHTKMTWSKLLFLFNRYMVPIAMLLRTNDFSGIALPVLSNTYCRWSIGTVTILGILTIGISNFLVLLRLWMLWDRNSRLMYWTGIAFLTAQIAAFIVAGFVVRSLLPFVVFEPTFHACLIEEKPRVNVGGLWVPGLAFEVMVFVVVWWNALDRPRSCDSGITKAMYRDGFLYFSVLFVLRLINLVLAIIAPVSLLFLGVLFIWCAANVTLSRLILNSRQLASDVAEDKDFSVSFQQTSRHASIDTIIHLGYELEPRK